MNLQAASAALRGLLVRARRAPTAIGLTSGYKRIASKLPSLRSSVRLRALPDLAWGAVVASLIVAEFVTFLGFLRSFCWWRAAFGALLVASIWIAGFQHGIRQKSWPFEPSIEMSRGVGPYSFTVTVWCQSWHGRAVRFEARADGLCYSEDAGPISTAGVN